MINAEEDERDAGLTMTQTEASEDGAGEKVESGGLVGRLSKIAEKLGPETINWAERKKLTKDVSIYRASPKECHTCGHSFSDLQSCFLIDLLQVSESSLAKRKCSSSVYSMWKTYVNTEKNCYSTILNTVDVLLVFP